MDNTIDMRALSVAKTANAAGWMRNASFDLVFIVGVATLALLTGWLSVANPALFPLLLILNVWILGYHHVIATFTRRRKASGFPGVMGFGFAAAPPMFEAQPRAI
jgi:hypothetical protein